MKEIKILGTGCPKCKTTIRIVEEVVQEKGLIVSIVKVEDIMEIMKYDILSTPAIVIDEEIVLKGKVPSKKDVEALLT